MPIYIGLGGAAVFWQPQFASHGGAAVLTPIIVGGLMYTAGAVIYGMRRPNPSPGGGFHEVFHAFTLARFANRHVRIWLAALWLGAVAAT